MGKGSNGGENPIVTHPLREPGIGGRTGNYAVRSRLGRHGPGGPSSGWHTLQGRKPAANAASREAKWTLCSGFVRRPGGQFGRQKMCVVVQPFRVISFVIILPLATGSSRRAPSNTKHPNIKLGACRERLASILDCLMRRQTNRQPEGPSSCDLAASVRTIRRRN